MCFSQQPSGQWLIQAIENTKLGTPVSTFSWFVLFPSSVLWPNHFQCDPLSGNVPVSGEQLSPSDSIVLSECRDISCCTNTYIHASHSVVWRYTCLVCTEPKSLNVHAHSTCSCTVFGDFWACPLCFLGPNVSLYLSVDPRSPLALPEFRFLGPEHGKHCVRV